MVLLFSFADEPRSWKIQLFKFQLVSIKQLCQFLRYLEMNCAEIDSESM